MPAFRPIILLTGFGPFPGVAENASSLLMPRLTTDAAAAFPGYAVRTEVLPTDWIAAPTRLLTCLRQFRPVVALHFGVSQRARGFVIEARGRNFAGPAPDVGGATVCAGPIAEGGPEFLSTQLPAALIVERLRRRGLPANLSLNAGSYLCNAVLYRSLDHVKHESARIRSGFIHIPTGLVGAAERRLSPRANCALDWDDTIDGALEIIAASLGLPPRPGGRRGVRPRVHPAPAKGPALRELRPR